MGLFDKKDKDNDKDNGKKKPGKKYTRKELDALIAESAAEIIAGEEADEAEIEDAVNQALADYKKHHPDVVIPPETEATVKESAATAVAKRQRKARKAKSPPSANRGESSNLSPFGYAIGAAVGGGLLSGFLGYGVGVGAVGGGLAGYAYGKATEDEDSGGFLSGIFGNGG